MPIAVADPEVPHFLAGGGEMADRIRSYNWTATSLGAPTVWPQSLRSALSLCLHSAFPTAVYWGAELLLFYNDSYIESLADRHQSALAQPAAQVWGDVWYLIEPQVQQVLETGAGLTVSELLLPLHRDG